MPQRRTYRRRRAPVRRTYRARRAPVRRSYRRAAAPSGKSSKARNMWAKALSTVIPPLISSGLTAAGSIVGGPALGALGGIIGASAGKLMNKITGEGDYNVRYNTILKPDSVPMFVDAGRSVIISHREYIQDIVSGAPNTFKIETFSVQPGDNGTFPWLSNIAGQFEEYRIHGMIFEYKTMSADALNSTNTALGQVVMATQYNVLLPTFQNKQQMENYEFGTSVKPSSSVIHPIECDPAVTSFGPIFQVRIDGNTAQGDARLYDMAKFSIATNGMQGTNVNCGELWVSYQIEFLKPRMGNTNFASQYHLGGDGGTIIAADMFSDAVLADNSADNGITFGTNTIVFPNWLSGNVIINYSCFGTVAAACVDPTFTGTLGATGLNILNNNTENQRKNTYAAGTVAFETSAYFTLVNGGTVTLSAATLPTGVVIGDVVVASLPNGFLV